MEVIEYDRRDTTLCTTNDLLIGGCLAEFCGSEALAAAIESEKPLMARHAPGLAEEYSGTLPIISAEGIMAGAMPKNFHETPQKLAQARYSIESTGVDPEDIDQMLELLEAQAKLEVKADDGTPVPALPWTMIGESERTKLGHNPGDSTVVATR